MNVFPNASNGSAYELIISSRKRQSSSLFLHTCLIFVVCIAKYLQGDTALSLFSNNNFTYLLLDAALCKQAIDTFCDVFFLSGHSSKTYNIRGILYRHEYSPSEMAYMLVVWTSTCRSTRHFISCFLFLCLYAGPNRQRLASGQKSAFKYSSLQRWSTNVFFHNLAFPSPSRFETPTFEQSP